MSPAKAAVSPGINISGSAGALTLMANPTLQTGAIGPSAIVTIGK